MMDAQPFLDELCCEWRRVDRIASVVAKKYDCPIEDVLNDADAVIEELKTQGFVECDGEIGDCPKTAQAKDFLERECVDEKIDDDSPLTEFYSRHCIPIELHIDLTDKCNERCVHCYVPRDVGFFMQTELALKVMREFRAIEGLSVCVSGGECMLHPELSTILLEAKHLGLNIVLMSNLTLCDVKMLQLIREVDPQYVNVSLYSMIPDEHDSITQLPGSWEKTVKAIYALKDAGVHVRLASPIMRQNKDAVEGLQTFAAEMQMHDIVDCDIFGRMNHDCSNRCHALDDYEAECLIRKYRQMLCQRKLENWQCAPDARVCEVGMFRLNVNAHGDYYPCDGGHGLVLGNAVVDSLEEVWHGEKLNKLRDLRNRDFPRCVSCVNRPWCKVCLMRNFNETGDMFMAAPERCTMAAIHRKIWEEQ